MNRSTAGLWLPLFCLLSVLPTSGCPAFGFVGGGGEGGSDGGSAVGDAGEEEQDAGDADGDGGDESPHDAGPVVIVPSCVAWLDCPELPRAIAPLSGQLVTTQQPTFRWERSEGEAEVRIELCRDRAFSSGCASFNATGTSRTVFSPLEPGVWFWRVVERIGAEDETRGATWSFVVGKRSSPVDTSFGTVQDFDRDGFADVAVGAELENRVYIYRGAAGALSDTPAVTLETPGNMEFGSRMAAADVNGDGYTDLILGAQSGEAPDDSGRVYVYHGGADGLAVEPAATLEPWFDSQFPGFGRGVAGAGDVNGDGFADVLVAEDQGDTTARVYLYFGGFDGVGGLAVETDATAWSGGLLAGLGDTNGDGFADYGIGGLGESTVYFGSREGVPVTEPITFSDGPETAWHPRSAGDVNGDGFADMVDQANGGSVANDNGLSLYLGGASGPSTTPDHSWTGDWAFGYALVAGDLDGDGYADLAIGGGVGGGVGVFRGSHDGVEGIAAVTIPTAAGGLLVPGDVDGDGFADLIVSGSSGVQLYRGGADGPSTTAAHTWTGPPGSAFGALAH